MMTFNAKEWTLDARLSGGQYSASAVSSGEYTDRKKDLRLYCNIQKETIDLCVVFQKKVLK